MGVYFLSSIDANFLKNNDLWHFEPIYKVNRLEKEISLITFCLVVALQILIALLCATRNNGCIVSTTKCAC